MTNTHKIVVLTQEDPSYPKFQAVNKLVGAYGIDPLNFIAPENHILANLYKDMFKDHMANQLLGYLVNKQPQLLVWDIMNAIHGTTANVITVNATLLTDEDIRFIEENVENVTTCILQGGSVKDIAGRLYNEVKVYTDLLTEPAVEEVKEL